ncbi:nicotinate-nicotinamide nucleotide adenylyltransferase [Aliikangiella coralliicola]|nr:nicotinate-nicotinamide nucleotide adenylyltransferase [Aliikangiella coralliicola]
MKNKKIGIIGSAFNPPHLGHKDVIEQVYRDYDEILLVPSYKHPFGKIMAPFNDRLFMASMMAQSYHSERFMHYEHITPILTSNIERDIYLKNSAKKNNKDKAKNRDRPVYTYDVLAELEQRYKTSGIDADLTFVIGPDNASYETWNKFYKSEEILQRWNIRSVSERVPVHSSLIRELIADYPRPDFLFESRFKNYLDGLVARYIFNQKLYGVHL